MYIYVVFIHDRGGGYECIGLLTGVGCNIYKRLHIYVCVFVWVYILYFMWCLYIYMCIVFIRGRGGGYECSKDLHTCSRFSYIYVYILYIYILYIYIYIHIYIYIYIYTHIYIYSCILHLYVAGEVAMGVAEILQEWGLLDSQQAEQVCVT